MRLVMAEKMHFTGIAGSGMSALSQMSFWDGNEVSGSDRDFDRGKKETLGKSFEKMGIGIFPQDGSGVNESVDKVVVSTAVEDSNPDIAKARKSGIPVIHRSEFLSSYVDRFRTVAVSGTSGKSSTVAMLYEILSAAGLSPSVINGAEILSLRERGLIGNAFRGKGDILVMESDESDGSMTRYCPAFGVILNISEDHKSPGEIKNIFLKFSENCGKVFVNSLEINDPDFWGPDFIPFPDCNARLENVRCRGFSSEFGINGVKFRLPLPGVYNARNAFAACRLAMHFGVDLGKMAEALANYKGIFRRFNLIGDFDGIRVIDDYAHNPAKISAVLGALKKAVRGRIFAVYQPHGFAPARKFRKGIVGAFSVLGKDDVLIMPEIFYAGGTAARNISSADLVGDARKSGLNAFFKPLRKDIIEICSGRAASGDAVIVMGARDSSLSDLARDICEETRKKRFKEGIL